MYDTLPAVSYRGKMKRDEIPEQLWYRGNQTALDSLRVAIIGARACSSYGRSIARGLSMELAQKGVTVISGLARGIDSEAHRGALEAGGQTVAVMATGPDRIYPHAHAELGERITESGLLVTEFPPGTEPAPWRFPARNRIIAALSDIVVVVEARDRSGSLITADFALDYGIPLMAVPGELTSLLSEGTNRLLADGKAAFCTGAGSILDLLSRLERR